MRKLLLCFAFTCLAATGCATTHKARAEAHHDVAKRDFDHGHPIKALKQENKAADEREKAREDEHRENF